MTENQHKNEEKNVPGLTS